MDGAKVHKRGISHGGEKVKKMKMKVGSEFQSLLFPLAEGFFGGAGEPWGSRKPQPGGKSGCGGDKVTDERLTIIEEIRKNAAEVIRISLISGPNMMLDVRVWRGEWAGQGGAENETDQGFSLAVELLPVLQRAISVAMRTAGLEDPGLEVRGDG
jgi:hypothetical protein